MSLSSSKDEKFEFDFFGQFWREGEREGGREGEGEREGERGAGGEGERVRGVRERVRGRE